MRHDVEDLRRVVSIGVARYRFALHGGDENRGRSDRAGEEFGPEKREVDDRVDVETTEQIKPCLDRFRRPIVQQPLCRQQKAHPAVSREQVL